MSLIKVFAFFKKKNSFLELPSMMGVLLNREAGQGVKEKQENE